jgi:SlyX protein
MQEAIDDLQMKLAFQEDLLEQLNQVVTEQQQQITNLELALETMKVQVNTMQTATQESGQQHELPPHY